MTPKHRQRRNTTPSSPIASSNNNNSPDDTTTIPSDANNDNTNNNTAETTTAPYFEDRINPLDLNSVKCAIDDQIIRSLEYTQQFSEDHTLTNLKIILGLIAVVAAVYAYFEQNTMLTASLCLTYIVISIILQLLGWFLQGHCFFVSRAIKGRVVRVSGWFQEAYSDKYVMLLESYMDKGGLFGNFSFKNEQQNSSKNDDSYYRKEIALDVTKVFDEHGNMERMAVANHVDEFLDQLQEEFMKQE